MAKMIFAVLASLLTLPAMAAPETALYAGKAAADSSLSVAAWGAGSAQDSTAVYLFGGHSLRITTLDLHQGALVSFTAPIPLGDEPGRFFQLTLRRGAPTLHYDPRTLPGASPASNPTPTNPGAGPTGMPGMGVPGMGVPGMGMPGMGVPGMGVPGMGFPTGAGTGGRGRHSHGPMPPNAPETAQIPPIKNLRLLFTLSDGRQADVLRPIPAESDGNVGEGWYSVNVPLSLLKFPITGPAKAAELPMLKSVTIGGDQYGVFYIGRMRLATDTAPITASIEGPASAVADSDIALRAKADGGLSTLQYLWDFGHSGNAFDQATGAEATTSYAVAGQDYTVTLTVSDRDGFKKPAQATKVIHVTEEQPRTQPGVPGMGIPGMGIPGTGIPGMGGFPAQP